MNSSNTRTIILLMGGIFFCAAGCEMSDPAVQVRAPAETILTNTVGMKFVRIPAGEFVMGSPTSEPRRELDEVQHTVRLTRDFYMGQTEVTRGQFAAFVKETKYVSEAERAGDYRTWQEPGIKQTDAHPVVCVTFEDARAFCAWLSRKDHHNYRLPSEAEWEYSCRAGTSTTFYTGPTITTEQANFNGNTTYAGGTKGINRSGTTPAAMFPPNAWGLYDMTGNVWEWCNDWYAHFPGGPQVDPKGPATGTAHTTRGGSWVNAPEYCRIAYRYAGAPTERHTVLGFRCVMDR